jgi:hypothetical protein
MDVDNLMGLLAALPGEKLAEALYSGSASVTPMLAVRSVIDSYGHWGTIRKLYQTKRLADEVLDHYQRYPSRPSALPAWQDRRDDLLERVYETTGADPKY